MRGIFSQVFERKNDLSLTNPKAWDPTLWNLYGAQSNAGMNVTEHTALNYSAVYNAISLIAGTVGSLPLHLYRKGDNKKSLATNKTLYRVMHTQANPYMSAMQFRETIAAHVLSWGNGYAEIMPNVMGDAVALWPIPPNRIRPRMQEGELVYEVRVDNETIILPRARILHIAGLGFDGFMGYSVIRMAREAIGLGMAMEKFGALFFGNGTHPGIIVSHPGKLSPDAHDNLKKDMMDKYSGLGNTHRLLLLEEGMKIDKIAIPPEESQFLQTRQFQIPEIARWFNLPPHKLKDLTRSSFNNIEAEQISFVTDSILPWLVRFEQCYNMQLLSANERQRGNLYFKHSVEGLLRGNAENRATFYNKMFMCGAMSQNEIRAKEDMDPVENGDEYFVPRNMIPVSKLDDMDFSGKNNLPGEKEEPGEIEEKPPTGKRITLLRQGE